MKRAREEGPGPLNEAKRARLDDIHTDRFSRLSHELTLRILSNLAVNDLAVCHRLSRHFQALSSDSQLWKAHYYNRFVRPRAARIPSVRSRGPDGDSAQHLHFSSKLSKWLDEDKLVRNGRRTNWKRQYKLRHNWAQGTCSVTEIPVSDSQSVPPLLVAMKDSTIFLADRADGLRAWGSAAAGKGLLASIGWDAVPGHDSASPPSALAVDMAKHGSPATKLAVGFVDGSFSLFALDQHRSFQHLYRHPPSSNGTLSAIALSLPHLATMTATQLLSIYAFPPTTTTISPPSLIHSLHSTSVSPPLTLSIRPLPDSTTVVALAYALPSYPRSSTLTVQELHLSPPPLQTGLEEAAGQAILSSRLATALLPAAARAPAALSYRHPYLLAAHRDNTLTLHLVRSSSSSREGGLRIAPPATLWGHTSAVAGATVGHRGRAVSVASGARGEVRVWDLEARVASAAAERRREGEGVRVVPGNRTETGGGVSSCAAETREEEEGTMTGGWVGFDEESVVLLRERGSGQSLVVYDFA